MSSSPIIQLVTVGLAASDAVRQVADTHAQGPVAITAAASHDKAIDLALMHCMSSPTVLVLVGPTTHAIRRGELKQIIETARQRQLTSRPSVIHVESAGQILHAPAASALAYLLGPMD